MDPWDDEAAEAYAAKYGDYATNKLAVEALEIPPGSTIVDIGCGTGSALRRAADRVEEGRFVGVDPVPRMIEIARERTSDHPHAGCIEYVEGSATDVPLESGLADLVFAFDSFDYWDDQPAGLREAARLLKPGGTLVLVKDLGVPGARASGLIMETYLEAEGFQVILKTNLEGEGVRCTMWICVPPRG